LKIAIAERMRNYWKGRKARINDARSWGKIQVTIIEKVRFRKE
jgi:hypothetical protein